MILPFYGTYPIDELINFDKKIIKYDKDLFNPKNMKAESERVASFKDALDAATGIINAGKDDLYRYITGQPASKQPTSAQQKNINNLLPSLPPPPKTPQMPQLYPQGGKTAPKNTDSKLDFIGDFDWATILKVGGITLGGIFILMLFLKK